MQEQITNTAELKSGMCLTFKNEETGKHLMTIESEKGTMEVEVSTGDIREVADTAEIYLMRVNQNRL